MKQAIALTFLLYVILWSPVQTVSAQEVHQELKAILPAEVIEVLDEREEQIMGTDARTTVQTITVALTDGEREGEQVTFENDLITLAPGDNIFITHVVTINGDEYYYLKDVNRHLELWVLLALFVVLLLWFAGKQGARALASLALSIGSIIFILIPAMLAGYDPIAVSLGIAGLILAIVLIGTHGINPRSLTALGGTFGAVVVTSIVAYIFVHSMRLTVFGSDASVYLNFATGGQLDF